MFLAEGETGEWILVVAEVGPFAMTGTRKEFI